MNLIEKLGGYDEAKNHRDYLIDFGNEFNRPNKHEVDSLNEALLEHRRENNIFEFGDLVVDTTGFFDWLCRVEYLSSDDRVVMYKYDQRKGDTAFTTCPSIVSVRHATLEEIKAGHRL